MLGVVAAVAAAASNDGKSRRRSILYIVVDDLRAELWPFSPSPIHSPQLKALAERGTTFTRAYCQQAVCGPSRNSFMSGRIPDRTRAWNFKTSFRDTINGTSWTSLPGHFKASGYRSLLAPLT